MRSFFFWVIPLAILLMSPECARYFFPNKIILHFNKKNESKQFRKFRVLIETLKSSVGFETIPKLCELVTT